MKTRSLALLTISIILGLVASCAGKPEIPDQAPEWALTIPEDTDTARIFRGEGEEDSLNAARAAAIEDLGKAVLAAMNLGDPKEWNAEGASAVKAMLDELSRIVRGIDGAALEGVEVLRQQGWRNAEGNITYMVDISWENGAFDDMVAELSRLLTRASPEYSELEARAVAAEADGNLYEAALIWATAAGVAQRNGNTAALKFALREIVRLLDGLMFTLTAVPAEALVGLRPSSPVLFSVTALSRPVGNAEFVIIYPKNSRDGTPSRLGGAARLLSDNNGIVRFLSPEVPFAGSQIITIAPSAEPFLEYLDDTRDAFIDQFIKDVERERARGEYEALPRTRVIPTGILILETDLTGNPLNTGDAAKGVLDDLLADGFDVGLINLNVSQIAGRSELELLRDLKADGRVSGRFERVIHGQVKLESFEQSGDNFNVKVSGTIILSDIQRQVGVYRSEISKTSRAAGSQQAISAAFRQLGRSFAEELIKELP